MRIFLKTLFIFLLFIASAIPAFAEGNSFITIVNPVRVSTYTKDLALNMGIQYDALNQRKLPATWLLTYDTLLKPDVINLVQTFNKNQELGLFLEVTPVFSKAAGVKYNLTGNWYRATSLFLSGYLQDDRKKLIDTVFESFKEKFGYYPKSVGSWWTDAYSLQYMRNKYGITGVLGVSDQYNLDGYQIWGTPYGAPYYPSKINAALPAPSQSEKIDVVTFRWAARDPLNGYISPGKEESSLYSVQDYNRLGLDDSYYKTLVNDYSTKNEFNEFGQITIGLESDYSPVAYTGQYSKWLEIVKEQQDLGTKVTNMQGFSEWYMEKFPKTTPQQIIYGGDYLGTDKKIYWVNNNLYRIGLLYSPNSSISSLIDFRSYFENFMEPFYEAPNKQYYLSINLPFIIDSVNDNKTKFDFNAGPLISAKNESQTFSINFEKGSIDFGPTSIVFNNIELPADILSSNQVKVVKNQDRYIVYPKKNYPIGDKGIFYSDYSFHIPFTFARKINKFIWPVALAGLIISTALCIFFLKKYKGKTFLFLGLLIIFFGASYLALGNIRYYISQTEMDALSVLSRLPKGKVLVYQRDCLRCDFVTSKPAAAAGKKEYVGKFGNHEVIYDSKFNIAPSSKIASSILKQESVRYIYLSKYEDYIEPLPYIPQDLGIHRVYENANVEIWEVL